MKEIFKNFFICLKDEFCYFVLMFLILFVLTLWTDATNSLSIIETSMEKIFKCDFSAYSIELNFAFLIIVLFIITIPFLFIDITSYRIINILISFSFDVLYYLHSISIGYIISLLISLIFSVSFVITLLAITIITFIIETFIESK